MYEELDIPEFLKRNGAPLSWDSEASVARITTQREEEEIPLPAGLRLAQTSYEESGFMVADGVVPRRWCNDNATVMYILRSLNERSAKRTAQMEKFKTDMAERKAAKPKANKPEFGKDLVMTPITPRREGTNAAGRFNSMRAYLQKHPNATVAEVFANTSYTKGDYDWDLERKRIKVDVKNGR